MSKHRLSLGLEERGPKRQNSYNGEPTTDATIPIWHEFVYDQTEIEKLHTIQVLFPHGPLVETAIPASDGRKIAKSKKSTKAASQEESKVSHAATEAVDKESAQQYWIV
jgi:hypothetical protein